jgi:hypothetical protein
MRQPILPSALVLALGIALAGLWIGRGFVDGRRVDRFVSVKGLSERNVDADIALWPIQFVATHNELARAQAQSDQSKQKILEFLAAHGIAADQVAVQSLAVNDLLANPYRSGTIESRYIIRQTLMVRSSQPTTILKASQAVSELIAAGVILDSEMGQGSRPTYLFSGLTSLKPEMIAEATKDARAAAEQFAQDSGSRLGGIRQANQGVFAILPRDRAPGISEEGELHKTVRVVATIDYYLED